MQNLVVAGAALAFALVSAAPLSAADNPEKSAKSGTAFTSPFSPEAIAASFMLAEENQSESRLAELDERIAQNRRGVSRGKKMLLWGAAIAGGGLALAAIGSDQNSECFNSDSVLPKGCTTRQNIGIYTSAAGMVVALGGGITWASNAGSLRRAEAERRTLQVSVGPAAVAANYRFSW